MKILIRLLIAVVISLLAGWVATSLAADRSAETLPDIAEVESFPAALLFAPVINDDFTLTIRGPGSFFNRQHYAAGELLELSANTFAADGDYRYELFYSRVSDAEQPPQIFLADDTLPEQSEHVREQWQQAQADRERSLQVSQSGWFRIEAGLITMANGHQVGQEADYE